MKPSRIVDIFVNVIDNTGDMGFACELIAGLHRQYPDTCSFDIWTDSVAKIVEFFQLNQDILPIYTIHDIDDFGIHRQSSLAFSLFHAPIPDAHFFTHGSLVLRFDYLSFDTSWLVHTGDEHISSTPSRQIIEVIPSPLPLGSGLIPTYQRATTRAELAKQYGLDSDKKWIPIFAYTNTLKNTLAIDTVSEEYEIILFGDQKIHTIKTIPWVDIATWHSFIDESEWIIARGEVSAMATLVRGKLGFWDMYKEIGGFHAAQSDDFLTYRESDEQYRILHMGLNGQRDAPITLSELIEYQEGVSKNQARKIPRTKNLLTEIQKCIDSHEFSI